MAISKPWQAAQGHPRLASVLLQNGLLSCPLALWVWASGGRRRMVYGCASFPSSLTTHSPFLACAQALICSSVAVGSLPNRSIPPSLIHFISSPQVSLTAVWFSSSCPPVAHLQNLFKAAGNTPCLAGRQLHCKISIALLPKSLYFTDLLEDLQLPQALSLCS